jgi:hypothetical protein
LYHPNSVARVTNCRNYVLAKTIVMAMAIFRYLPRARCRWWSQSHNFHCYRMSITNGQPRIADSRLRTVYDLTEISFGVRFLTLAAEKFVGSTGATGVLIS